MRKVGCKKIRFQIVYRFKDKYPVRDLCALLRVSRSGYYRWLSNKDNPDKDKVIADLIREYHAKSYRTYGYRRMKIWLLKETGLVINHKAVLRIMRKYDLLAPRKKKKWVRLEGLQYYKYNNLLNRDFSTTKPNEKWATDISYIPTKQGFLYLSVIKDLYDNSIVAYRYATNMELPLVTGTVIDAVKKEKVTTKLQLHSDQGIQYTSIPYHNLSKLYGIELSMSRAGNPYDNACAENFFSMLKNECIYKIKPKTIMEAKEIVDEYIYFYNNERIQLKTGLTPLEVRQLALA